MEGTAERSATGPENQGAVKRGRSIRLPSAMGRVGQVVSPGGCKPLAISIRLCKFDSYSYHQQGNRPIGRVMGLKIPKVRVRIPLSLSIFRCKKGHRPTGRVVRLKPGMLKVRIFLSLPLMGA